MANTVSTANLRAQLWLKELHKDVMDGLYFSQRKMMGKDSNNIIQIKDELAKQAGDRVTFGLTYKISGGVTGDGELEGNEKQVSSYSCSVLIDQIRNAVRLTGKLDEQKVAYDMRMDAKDKLAIWKTEFIERQIFMKLGGVTEVDLQDVNDSVYSEFAAWSNSPNVVPTADEGSGNGTRYLCADASGLDSLAATDILTTTLITRARVKAQLASPKIQPIRVDGKDYYVMFVHPWQAADLKTASNSIWAQAQREAQVRGESNPIFTGSLGVWDGVILHEHEYVPVCQSGANFDTAGQAAGAQAFRSILCGRQAISFAECQNPNGWVEETFDYKNKVGFETGMIGGIQKTYFNSLDYGIVTVDTGATDIG